MLNTPKYLALVATLLTPVCWAEVVDATDTTETRLDVAIETKKPDVDTVETLRLKRSENWGIAATLRSAGVPYAEGGSANVSSFVPMMFYQDEAFFINGTEGGIRLWEEDEWRVNAILRMRFIDLPTAVQNDIGGDTGDFGFQLKRQLGDGWYADLDVLSDKDYRFHSVATLGKTIHTEDFDLDATVSARYKDADFNSFYYGLSEYRNEGVHIGAGVDLKAGMKGRYHVYSNLYLVGAAYATYFDKNVRHAATIDKNWQGEVFAGFGFFNDHKRDGEREISTRPYWRLAYGWATPSNIGEIIAGDTVKDPYGNTLTSVFYGHPLTDSLFGVPLDIYLTPGVVWHWSSEVQASSPEFVMAIKAYYTFDWPTEWRIGAAEGLSYVNNITYVESSEMERKGYEPSHLLNYIDLSVDVNVGDLIGQKKLNNLWLGYSIHHRSAIFEKASQFGRIKGGSNYNTIYLQMDF
ncbi:MltA-interacting MipA family protein [Enterovibrio norvegicus FF-162]|uniref:MltA-interacting MipA family protein n=1 Tax=Enterovibrio norvegicus FF-454 TaxID=1185651 RepID=A0A1E5BY12_9GAMM|nr:MipA/OmpV family protein [Enterovibrio norvegicus]OEE58089.1 MltA-interacting MipA family protein [Enterovibrio norvegicus FF-454]OEE76726.1 MltA-interacting MipA family protein [Enterovibrio norvegicus FF-162]